MCTVPHSAMMGQYYNTIIVKLNCVAPKWSSSYSRVQWYLHRVNGMPYELIKHPEQHPRGSN